MERIITSFAVELRRKGVRVSPGESLDAVQALALGGLEGRESVRALLQLTLVKNANDIPLFNELFDSFFSSYALKELQVDGAELMSVLVHIVEGELIKEETAAKDDEEGPKLLLDDEVAPEDLEDLVAMEESDDDEEGAEVLVQLEGYNGKLEAPKPSDYYMENPPTMAFHQPGAKNRELPFTPEEISAMQEVVCQMLVRIRKDVKRMKERESRGKLHVVRTIQRNYRHGMIPFIPVLRRKRKEKPRLVVFCDVSYSVSHATRFMLLLLHTLQNRLMDVRSFVFNAELVEITSRLRNMPVNSLLQTIDDGDIVNLDDNSDYGRVFKTFKEKHLEAMRGKPAIIVMGDGRNNYNEANDWALEEIREKAGYLLWLTPEERDIWNRGDCLLELYGTYCDAVEVVGSVDDLSRLVEDLFCTLYDHNDTRAWKGRSHEITQEPLDYREYYTRGKPSSPPAFDPEIRRRW
jgi:uncharacterized protein